MASNPSKAPKLQSFAINPGKGLGSMLLGGSLKDILTYIRAQITSQYPKVKIQCDNADPVRQPVHIFLPENGLRLRFDGPDQRLRLIEIIDFGKLQLTYKDQDLVKNEGEDRGPSFKSVYGKLFGPTFEGKREASPPGCHCDTYVLSYPGVAFTFAISPEITDSDFVSILSRSDTSDATGMAIFNGASWGDARPSIWTRPCPHPRSLALVHNPKVPQPDEIDLAVIKGYGKIEFRRRSAKSFNLILSETTPQDLILNLGPPNQINKKNDHRMAIHKKRAASTSVKDLTAELLATHLDTDQSSINTTTDFSSDKDESKTSSKASSEEFFYHYYDHGFSILVSQQLRYSPPLVPDQPGADDDIIRTTSPWLVATKLILNGNVPTSHDFHTYRRLRWVLDPKVIVTLKSKAITSETPFTAIRDKLDAEWGVLFAEHDRRRGHVEQRHMVVNRGWGNSPSSSIELLGGWEDTGSSRTAEATLKLIPGNTDLWAYQGLIFEVLKTDVVSVLTVF